MSQTLYNMELQQLVRDDSCAEPHRESSGSYSSVSVIDLPTASETREGQSDVVQRVAVLWADED